MRVLVTGAAGLVGRELCRRLAAGGHGVVALLRRNRAITGNDGVPVPTCDWTDEPARPGEVMALTGDVAEAGFGLDRTTTAQLMAGLDLVIHCAALTGFNLDPALYQRVNVGGVAHALAFAGERRIPFLHVSTAYVCGEQDGVIAEAPATGGCFANGYESSKAAGETLVLAAARAGLPVAIARPSIIAGDSQDGAIGEFTNLYQLLRLITEGRVCCLPATADASLDLVPIDHVVASLIDIAEGMPHARGQIFHLASGCPVPVAALAPVLLGYKQFCVPSFVDPANFDTSGLTLREKWVAEQVTEVFATYLRRNPLFQTANLRALSGRVCPPTQAAYLRQLLGYALTRGYLAARPRKGRDSGARCESALPLREQADA